jgi:hypothetical protein
MASCRDFVGVYVYYQLFVHINQQKPEKEHIGCLCLIKQKQKMERKST